ncbi:MAG: putative polymerase, partial [Geminicoccaceae bacterium]|nr:putative polymerase [Geminicoccaceae bacterium]
PSGGGTPAPGDGPWRRVIEALLLRPAAARDAAGSDRLRLPAPDHALAARLLRWVEAFGASATATEGETSDPPARDSEPGAALRSALTDLARQAREPQADGWRVLLMALGGEDPIPLKLYLRDPPVDPERHPRSSRDRQVSTRRAIFEVELSRLGRCQLDVLCQARRFDLVVRSAEPLAAGLQDDIRSLVRAASELAGWAGVVEFRVAELLPLPKARAAAGQQITS